MRFLISRLSALGDVVCSLPAAVALKKGHPGCEVAWIVDPRFKAIVEACSAVDLVLRPDEDCHGEFEAAIDLQGLLKSAWPIARCKAGQKLGYHWQREGAWLFTQAVSPDPTSFHVVDQYVDVARAAGGEMDRAEFGLVPKPEAAESVAKRLQGLERFVIFNAGAGWVTKRWPLDRFAKLNDILQDSGHRVLLIGSQGDSEAAEELSAASSKKPLNWVGQTSISELIALIAHCDAHVGGDTGSTHLAAALGRPAIGLYSVTDPIRSCPYGQFDNCLYDPDSLANIQVEQVYSRVMENLQ